MSDDIRLDQGDVAIEEIFDECEECTVGPTTHLVTIDFRSAGMQHTVGRYCRACAEDVAARIRDGLPAPSTVGQATSDGVACSPQGAAGQSRPGPGEATGERL